MFASTNHQWLVESIFQKRFLWSEYEISPGEYLYSLTFPKDPTIPEETFILYSVDNPLNSFVCGHTTTFSDGWIQFLSSFGLHYQAFFWLDYINYKIALLIFLFGLISLLYYLFGTDLVEQISIPTLPIRDQVEISYPLAIRVQSYLQLICHSAVLLFFSLFSYSAFFPKQSIIPCPLPYLFPSIAQFLTFFLPILLCPYLAYFFVVVYTNWRRVNQKWELIEDGIRQRKKFFRWDEIKNLATLELPDAWRLRYLHKNIVAVLTTKSGFHIVLSQKIPHFSSLVARIQSQISTQEPTGEVNQFLRKYHSRRQLVKIIAVIFIIAFCFLFPQVIRKHQEEMVKIAEKVIPESKSITDNLRMISFSSSEPGFFQNVEFYTLVNTKEDPQIYLHPSYPYYWFSDQVHHEAYELPRVLSNISNTLQIIFLCFIIYILLLFTWYLSGSILGKPGMTITTAEISS